MLAPGWTASAAKHLTHRLYSHRAYNGRGGEGSDLVQYYKRETVNRLNPFGVSLYLTSALSRKDISDEVQYAAASLFVGPCTPPLGRDGQGKDNN